MRSELVGLLDKADIAISTGAGVADAEALEQAAETVRNARIRLMYPEDVLVVALVGGTGSGKSSIANALCETEAAEIGGVRPTTGEPLALLPPRLSTVMSGYLDSLGVTRRHPQKVSERLCVLDMPDTDSVELENRLQVEALLPRLDVVIWVLDPEKYRDAVLHHRYLARLAPYSRQFVFVLNQADRLAKDEIDLVARDLELALTEDGIDSGTVIATAANPPAGPPTGIDQLRAHLERLADDKSGCFDKILIDLERAAHVLLRSTGGAGLGFEERVARVLADAAEDISQGKGEDATTSISAFLEELAKESGGSTGLALRELASGASTQVQRAREAAGSVRVPQRRWIQWSEPPQEPDAGARVEAARAVLEDVTAGPARKFLSRRAAANATLTDLAISVADLTARTRR